MLGPKEFQGVKGSLGLLVPGLLGALLALHAMVVPGPLLLNLGVGDEPFARGFRSGWERDGTTGSGETTFHWALDGSRLEFPFSVHSGEPVLRLRLARFSATPAAVRVLMAGRELDAWSQAPRGWTLREIPLGAVRGPLAFQFRSESVDELGVALDWAELQGCRLVVPARPVLLRIGLLLIAAPGLVALALGRRAALAALSLLLLALGASLQHDPLGAAWAFADGAAAALLVVMTLLALAWLLRRAWPDVELGPAAVGPALLGATVAVLITAHPFFHYPDVTTHARFLAALRGDPYLAWDATEYQKSTGTWAMREIAGRRIGFPYSPAFHVLALPLAPLLGEAAAVKGVGALAVGTSLLLVHLLARAAGLPGPWASLAQALLALFPVTTSRLSVALYPTLLGQALDLLLTVHIARRFPLLSGARDAAWLFFFLVLAQAAYTGSLFNVALLVGLFAAYELVSGDRARARRLLGAYAASLVFVLAVQYARFLPVLFRDVLPHASAGAASRSDAGAWGRFALFYGWLVPGVALLGAVSLSRAPRHMQRLLLSLLGAGLALLALRFAAPGLFRDAKEVELLAPTLAVLSAAGLAALAERGRLGRVAALALGVALLGWGAATSAAHYGRRFVSVGAAP